MIEIERKFLVCNLSFKTEAKSYQKIVQGYLNSNKERTVRIRIAGEKGFLTIKGKSNATGTTRSEWEKEIDLSDAKALLELCETGIISKTRYVVLFKNHTIEVDVFDNENEGLILAEIELQAENEKIDLPSWIAAEVTGDKRYYNSCLSKNPFKSW